MSIISQACTKIASGVSTAGTYALGVVEKGCAPLGGRVISILSSYGVSMPKFLGSIRFVSQPALIGVATVLAAIALAKLSMYVATKLDVAVKRATKKPSAAQRAPVYTPAVFAKKALSVVLKVGSIASIALVAYQIGRNFR